MWWGWRDDKGWIRVGLEESSGLAMAAASARLADKCFCLYACMAVEAQSMHRTLPVIHTTRHAAKRALHT